MQAANGVGLVGFDDNQGLYYRPGQIPPAVSTPQAPGIATTLTLLSPPTSGGYGTASDGAGPARDHDGAGRRTRS